MKEVAVLLMAHAGVPQPALWEAWLALCPPDKNLRLAIFTHKAPVKYESAFLREHELPLHMTTGWGDFALVKATVYSIELVLRQHPGVEMVFVVSGMDIPVQHPNDFFALEPRTYYMPLPSTKPPLREVDYLPLHKVSLAPTAKLDGNCGHACIHTTHVLRRLESQCVSEGM
jgi:hypothetical protein